MTSLTHHTPLRLRPIFFFSKELGTHFASGPWHSLADCYHDRGIRPEDLLPLISGLSHFLLEIYIDGCRHIQGQCLKALPRFVP